MPQPARLDITQYRGDTLTIAVTLWADANQSVPADLSRATVTAQIRVKATDDDPPVASFTVSVTGNTVTLGLPPAITAQLPSKGVWDAQVDWHSDHVNVQTVLAGSVVVNDDVTRP